MPTPKDSHPVALVLDREAFDAALAKAVDDALAQAAAVPRPALLTTDEIAHELRTSPATVRRLVKKGLPSLRLGDSPRFDLDEVLAWLRGDAA